MAGGMILRLRSRDGLERVTVDPSMTLSGLKLAVRDQLGVPLEGMALSTNAELLNAKAAGGAGELGGGGDGATLSALGLEHGALLYLAYPGEREVEPAYKPGPLDRRPFGAKLTAAEIAAKQTRIERQDAAAVASVSFERSAAQAFQAYVRDALGFSIKRAGILYGTVDESKVVRVEAVYEPEQQAQGPHALSLLRGTPDDAAADALGEALGLRKVGWVFSQAATAAAPPGADGVTPPARDFILSASEVKAMAAIQDEMGEHAVTVLVTLDDAPAGEGAASAAAAGHVHFEAFQASAQAVALAKAGWFDVPEDDDATAAPSGVVKMRNPAEPDLAEPVIVAGKDAASVDTDWFLCPVRITDHEGGLHSGTFPIEHRLVPQTRADLAACLKGRGSNRPYEKRLADFHLLLWLARQPHLEATDVAAIAAAAAGGAPLLEGHRVILDSIADGG